MLKNKHEIIIRIENGKYSARLGKEFCLLGLDNFLKLNSNRIGEDQIFIAIKENTVDIYYHQDNKVFLLTSTTYKDNNCVNVYQKMFIKDKPYIISKKGMLNLCSCELANAPCTNVVDQNSIGAILEGEVIKIYFNMSEIVEIKRCKEELIKRDINVYTKIDVDEGKTYIIGMDGNIIKCKCEKKLT